MNRRLFRSVYRDEPSGRALAKAFLDTWNELGHKPPDTVSLQADEPMPEGLLARIGKRDKKVVALLWLNEGDFPDLTLMANDQPRPALIMASYGMLGTKVNSLPESERGRFYLTYPYGLPDGTREHQAQGVSPIFEQRETALKMNSLFQAIPGALSRLRTFVYRDYFIELIEANPDLASATIIYPRLSFGQGQRYASKGCYVVQLGPGANPELIKRSEWVIH